MGITMTSCTRKIPGDNFKIILFNSLVSLTISLTLFLGFISLGPLSHASEPQSHITLRVGSPLPNSHLNGEEGQSVNLDDLKGHIKLISIVPQLNTPVCDEQTHRFSENMTDLGQNIQMITLSTNTVEDQAHFMTKAGISNMTFLSDSPSYEFGNRTGLLLPQLSVLHRAVIVADRNNIIRHLELVPMGQLPQFDAAQAAAKKLLDSESH